VLERHENVTIEMDNMYINEVPFFVMTSRGIHFGTAELIKNEKATTIATSIKQVLQMHHRKGFKVKHLHGDGQFEHIRKFFSDMDINLNTTRRNEHVPGVEHLRTVKEHVWAIANQLPFKTYPHRMIIEMIYNIVFWLNSFPHKDRMHDSLSPCTIMMGLHIDHNKHCKLEFGTYVLIHKEHDNSLMPSTTGAIALRPTGKTQGSHYFLNINSGHCITCNHWTVLPMPTEVIHTILRLATICKKYKGIVFTDKHGNIINDNTSADDM